MLSADLSAAVQKTVAHLRLPDLRIRISSPEEPELDGLVLRPAYNEPRPFSREVRYPNGTVKHTEGTEWSFYVDENDALKPLVPDGYDTLGWPVEYCEIVEP